MGTQGAQHQETAVSGLAGKWTTGFAGYNIALDLGYRHPDLYDEDAHEYIGGCDGAAAGRPALRCVWSFPKLSAIKTWRSLAELPNLGVEKSKRAVYNPG